VHIDFWQTLRRLRRDRGFTFTALITLALCISANVVIFAVVDAVVLRPLPFHHADRLVTTVNAYPQAGVVRAGSSVPNYYDRRELIDAFAQTAAIRGGSVIVGDAGSPKRVLIERVSPEFFSALGVTPLLGRTFTEEETEYARSSVVILTHGYWKNHFGADAEVVGRELRVDSQTFTIVGVLPAGFRFLSSQAQLFLPFASAPDDRGLQRRHSNNLQLIARLKPDATLPVAQAQVDALNARQVAEDPYAELLRSAGYHTRVKSLHLDHVEQVRPTLLLLQGGGLFLLVIGAVNLVNLLLIRASGRSKEVAVRQALGASRGRVAREVVTETVMLAWGGGLLGLAGGAAGIRLLAVLGTDRLPLGSQVGFDTRIAVVTLVGSLLIALLLAAPVIWFNLRSALAPVLQAETRSGTVSRAAQRLRHGFIVAQVALAFVLLVGAGLLGLSLQRVLAESPGFQPDRVLTGQLVLPWKNYPKPEPRLAFFERLLGELRAQPGVLSVGLSTALPLNGGHDNNATTVEGHERQPGESIQAHYTAGVVGEYWQAMGVPLREGRFLEDADHHRDLRVCVVDEDFARRYWPGESALGRRITNGPEFKAEDSATIVGVVGRVIHTQLGDTTAQGAVYYPYRWNASTAVYLTVRTGLIPEQLGPTLQQVVLRLDPELPVDDLRPMQARIDDSLVARKSPALLAGIFAAVALLLAAIGTYGVLAYAVAQRRREIGVRMALGALPSQILTQFLGLGAQLLMVGLLLGLVGAWGLGRAMQSTLFGVSAMELSLLASIAGVMMVVVLLASFLPSQRASRVLPLEALRDD
jgi:predicted permease